MAHAPPHPRSRGPRSVALGCAVLLACTTVRTQVSSIPAGVVIQDGRTEPQIDLWVESNEELTEGEVRRYREQAREALALALDGRSQPEGDAVLVVRAQGIGRTSGRKGDQTGTMVGLVVGAVAIVTVVILAALAGGDGKSKGKGGRAPAVAPSRPAGEARAAAPRPGLAPPRFAAPPRPVGPQVRPTPRPGGPLPVPWSRPPRPGPVVPPPSHLHPYGGVEVGLQVWWWPVFRGAPPPLWVEPSASAPPSEARPGPEAGAQDVELQGEQESPTRIALPPPEPMPLNERGFFAGDRLQLEALVLDRTTGEVLWTKRVRRDADPRDPRAVRAAIDELLKERGWAPPAPAGS